MFGKKLSVKAHSLKTFVQSRSHEVNWVPAHVHVWNSAGGPGRGPCIILTRLTLWVGRCGFTLKVRGQILVLSSPRLPRLGQQGSVNSMLDGPAASCRTLLAGVTLRDKWQDSTSNDGHTTSTFSHTCFFSVPPPTHTHTQSTHPHPPTSLWSQLYNLK